MDKILSYLSKQRDISDTSTTRKKIFRKNDIITIISMSLILSVFTFFINNGAFYSEQNNEIVSLTNNIFSLPFFILLPLVIIHSKNSLDPYGAALGGSIMATLLSPVIAFFLWFSLFYFFSRLSIKFIKKKNFFTRH